MFVGASSTLAPGAWAALSAGCPSPLHPWVHPLNTCPEPCLKGTHWALRSHSWSRSVGHPVFKSSPSSLCPLRQPPPCPMGAAARRAEHQQPCLHMGRAGVHRVAREQPRW